MAAFFDAAADRLGPLANLVNNAAAITAIGRLEDNDLAAIRRDLDVNLFGVIACTRHAARGTRHALARLGDGGAIVNISSGAATLGSPGEFVHYAAAKAGVDALTLGLSKELAERGIRVNAVAPGLVLTDFHPDPERPQRLLPTIPAGRPGRPEEIAAAVAWLLSPDASYTTGAILRVAGGR